ncbi:hypothetical protein GCM10010313_37960 [Streptomyces violarus]|uniref:Uncharacterized protein n=1 Tax=Streptomyces violarus TaxID=67380 RepID=A0A7W5F5Y6_9ACTN|nr:MULTISPECIES: hypothetical protein [Streptomyces]MBB3081271.1 hypothetical protein [Streptomyces violarus]WRU00373.1 hypothetical protein VJ737_23010 [Streptomyces sp. CGMCC 4.1772]GHD13296.1 hypothetical protein GCM10010313_37960 [Streptomyces violarus]
MNQPSMPIVSLPTNDYLPKHVHALADEWRHADERVKGIRKDYAEAIAALPQAQLDDAAALSEAVLANQPLPDDRENEKAVRARIEDGGRRLPIAEADRDQIGRRLVVALRAEDVRAHLVTATAADIRPALDSYLSALAEAERTVREAHQALTQATAPLAVVDALDTGSQVTLRPASPAGLPSYGQAREAAQRLAQQLDNLDERKTPRMRHVLLVDGRNVTVARELAADMLRDGIVEDWLDGWPAEEPSRPIGGAPANIADHFKHNRGQYVPHRDRDDAA